MILKICNTCKIEKDIDKFSKDSKSVDGHTYICKVCKNRKDKEYRRLNKHKIAQTKKACYIANKDYYSEYYRKRYEDKKENILEARKIYYTNNKLKCTINSRKRYLRKLLRTPKWLTREQFLEMEVFYEEAQRLSNIFKEPYHVDHIVPLKGDLVSGLHVPWNLQVITATENLQKSNKFKI